MNIENRPFEGRSTWLLVHGIHAAAGYAELLQRLKEAPCHLPSVEEMIWIQKAWSHIPPEALDSLKEIYDSTETGRNAFMNSIYGGDIRKLTCNPRGDSVLKAGFNLALMDWYCGTPVDVARGQEWMGLVHRCLQRPDLPESMRGPLELVYSCLESKCVDDVPLR